MCIIRYVIIIIIIIIICVDDGSMIFYDLARFDRVRRIDMVQWAADRQLPQLLRASVPRKLKCIHLYEDYQQNHHTGAETGSGGGGGVIVVGTSFGDVLVCKLGATI